MEMHYGTTPGTGDFATRMREEAAHMREEAAYEKEILQTIVDNIPVMIAFYDRGGRVELINRELESVLGWSLEEWQSRDLLAECYPDPQYRQEVVGYMLAAPLEWHDFQTRTRDGRNIDTRWLNTKLSDGRSIGIGENITDRKQLEHELRQSQKMEAVGLLAAGVAHELNNPLGAIVGYADILLEQDILNELARTYVTRIIQRAEQAAKIVQQLREFGRPAAIDNGEVNLNEVVRDTVQLLQNQMSVSGITVVTHLDPDVDRVWADRDCLEQVFLNIALNAKDAMPQGGEFAITTRTIQEGQCVEITFADTGVGIPEENLAKIFDPFFTFGKEQMRPDLVLSTGQQPFRDNNERPGKRVKSKRGTGLGLSISRRIVEDHGGQIKVESEEGRGTSFVVVLPKRG